MTTPNDSRSYFELPDDPHADEHTEECDRTECAEEECDRCRRDRPICHIEEKWAGDCDECAYSTILCHTCRGVECKTCGEMK